MMKDRVITDLIIFKKMTSEKVQQKEYKIYIMFFWIYLIINRIIPMICLITVEINSILACIMAIVGSLLIVQDLFTEGKLFKVKYYLIGLIYILIMFITSLINVKYGMIDNIKTIVWFSIQFFLFYIFVKRVNKKDIKSYIKQLFWMINVIWSLASVFSIIQYIFQIKYIVRIDNESIIRQGFCENRLFGVFSDPNKASIISLCIMIVIFCFVIKENKISRKITYCINILIHYSYIILSGSRTTMICMLAVVFLEILCIERNRNIKEKIDFKRAILKIIFMFIISLFFTMSTYVGSKKILSYLPVLNGKIEIKYESILKILAPNSYNNISLEELDNQGDKDTEEMLKREDVRKDNYFNNRTEIWKGYLQTLKGNKWIFGLSPRNAMPYILEKYPQSYLAKTEYLPHSEYIGVIVYTGLTGAIIILIFIWLLVVSVIKKLCSTCYLDEFYIASLSILVALGIYGMAFTDILFCNNLSGIIFWIALSIVLNFNVDKLEYSNKIMKDD